MADVAAALSALGIQEWVLRGEPTSEDEFKTMFSKVTGADSNGSAIESQDPADWGTTWAAIEAKQKELTDAEPMAELRSQRNAKLAATDWMGNSDVTMSAAWKTYRKELRDLPATAEPKLEDGVLTNVTWPTEPS